MNAPAGALEASPENFDSLVLGNSQKGLVLVHYWTPKAGPCLILMPRLLQLAADYGGRFLLVQVNTDELGRIARAQGVTSVPTVKFYLHGEVVHTIHGAESDSTFRAALGRFLASEADALRIQALRAHQAGRSEEAIGLLARAATDQPEDLAVAADLAKLLALTGQSAQALHLLAALPMEARRDGRIEWKRAVDAMRETLARWPSGVVAVWYPLKATAEAAGLERRVQAAVPTKVLRVNFRLRSDGPGLLGCGLLIANPPFGLGDQLSQELGPLARLLGGDRARAAVDWLVRERD